MSLDLNTILTSTLVVVLSAGILGLIKLLWSWNKQTAENCRKRNEERIRFHNDFSRLVKDSQALRTSSGVHTASEFPQGKINRFRNELTRTKSYLKTSVLNVAHETILGAEEMIVKGEVGDGWVDYIETQCKKAIKKNKIQPPRVLK